MPRKSTAPAKVKRHAATRRTRVYPRASSVKRYAVRGRGGYWDNIKKRWGEGGGKMKNQFEDAGAIIGGPVGRQLGGLFNRALYAITGFGDYKVRQNSLLEETNGPPMVVNRGKEFVVRHREYITDIFSAAGTANTPSPFVSQSYSINPGQINTFPWLSSIADKFEQFRVEGMVFEYKSLYSDAVVTQNGSIGSIILATEYNSGAPPFQNKQAMENYEFAQSCKPSLSVLHPIECARSQNVLSELYVRPSALPAGEDIKTYDFGDFQIASQGIPLGAAGAAVNLGELWVSYQISFLKPKINSVGANYIDSGYFRSSSPLSNNSFTPTTPLGVAGLLWNPSSGSNIAGIAVQSGTSPSITIPRQSVEMKYLLCIQWFSSTNSATNTWNAPGISSVTAGSSVDTTTYVQPLQVPIAVAPGNGCTLQCMLVVPARTASLTASVFTLGTTGNYDQVNGVRCNIVLNAIPTLGA